MSLGERLSQGLASERQRRTFRPAFFRLSRAADRRRLSALLSDAPPTVIDTLESQLLELMEMRDPRERSPEALRERAAAHLGATPSEAYGVWVHYPWRGRLVHLLPEAEFREVRTGRNRYEITAEEQARLGRIRVGIAGLSVGHATAITLALEGIGGELRLADFDTLGLANLNRLRTGVHHLGINKAVLCARELSELDPYLRLRVFPAGVTDQNVDAFLFEGGPLDLLIEECDDLYMKVLLREKARRARIPVLMETSDRGLLDIERFDLKPRRPLFHGRLGAVRAESLRGLRTADKIPFVLRIVDLPSISTRLATSLMEVDRTVATWPQLGSAVCLGGALNAEAARRIALGELRTSGRFYVDLERLIRDPERSMQPPVHPESPVHPERRHEVPESKGQRTSRVRDQPSDSAFRARRGQPEPSTPLRNAQAERASRVPTGPVRAILEAAIRAPSGGNSQPWRFEISGRKITCRIDPARAATFLDFRQWASHLALGAAAENAALEAAALGFTSELELLESRTDPDAAWMLTLPRRAGKPRVDPLRKFTSKRVTNRRLGPRVALDSESRDALVAAAESAGGRLRLLEREDALEEIGAILGEGERFRIFDERMHRDMMGELRWTREEAERTKDGLELSTLELSATDEAGMRVASRPEVVRLSSALGLGTALTEPSRKSVRAASAVGLLTFPGRDRTSYLRGGRCLERVWLTAQSRGLAFQPMTALPYIFARSELGVTEDFSASARRRLRRLRRRWRALLPVRKNEAELMIFRIARVPPPTARSERRPLANVLDLPAT